MKKYYSGEEIKIGDHITTDYGCDHNIITKIIDNNKEKKDYGVDCFGVLMFSSQVDGTIFVSFKEICSQDTKFVHRKTSSDKLFPDGFSHEDFRHTDKEDGFPLETPAPPNEGQRE